MARIDIDDGACAAVMERCALRSEREAVNVARRPLVYVIDADMLLLHRDGDVGALAS